jgi:transposase
MTNNKNEVMEVMEALTGPERRRRWSADERLAMFCRSKDRGGKLIDMRSTAYVASS